MIFPASRKSAMDFEYIDCTLWGEERDEDYNPVAAATAAAADDDDDQSIASGDKPSIREAMWRENIEEKILLLMMISV